MENAVSDNTMAILLLTTHLGKKPDAVAKPLGPTEWGEFAIWMHEHGLGPADLLRGDAKQTLCEWSHRNVTHARLEALLNRGSALGMALEKWQRAGLWVITRSDPVYPKLLKQRLRYQAPPVFFGCGSMQLLNQNGIAVVGSRSASEADLKFTRRLGASVADQAYSIVSGGARGVDAAAMLGALEAEGTCVGVLANDLLRTTASARYRRHLNAGNLVLVSPFNPEASFNTGNAMARNKYIYCLSRAGVAIHSGTKGGTWSGAVENLRYKWVPMWVKPTDDSQAGNPLLAELGAAWLPLDLTEIHVNELENPQCNANPPNNDHDEHSAARQVELQPVAEQGDQRTTTDEVAEPHGALELATAEVQEATLACEPTTYEEFMKVLEQLLSKPKTAMDLQGAEQFQRLSKQQLKMWLKGIEKDNRVQVAKNGNQKSYTWQGSLGIG